MSNSFLKFFGEPGDDSAYDNYDGFDAGEVIENQLWVGSLHATGDMTNLEKRGINSILTTARGMSAEMRDNCIYKQISMDDHPAEDLLSKLEEAFMFLDEQLQADRKVLVHCAAGVSRSVSVCVAYLMCRKGYPYKVALDMIRTNRPFANPNPGFTIQLTELEAANGDIEKAKAAYSKRFAGGSITASLVEWRDMANWIHRNIDDLEVKIHALHQDIDKQDMESRLIQLLNEAEAASSTSQVDRVSSLILKSATTKANRLLKFLQSPSNTSNDTIN